MLRERATQVVQLLLNALQDANADILTALNDVNDHGNSALTWASQQGDTAVVSLLIQALQYANADISTALNHRNNNGMTALMLASLKGHTKIVQLLLNALHTAGADILTAINHRSNNGMTLIRAASENGHRKIVKMLLAHGANLANANPLKIARLIAEDNKPAIAEEKLHMILQNGNLAWVGEVFANFDNKSKTELVSLNALASWGIILGNESFVAKMISCKRGNLSSVECTEYLRLALQAQKFSVAQTLLEYQPENIADVITHRQIILNYLLHLMVIEKGALSSIIFLLEQGAAPDNIIREENALMAHSLFKEHNKYQLGRVLAYVSSACAQKISQDSKTSEYCETFSY